MSDYLIFNFSIKILLFTMM